MPVEPGLDTDGSASPRPSILVRSRSTICQRRGASSTSAEVHADLTRNGPAGPGSRS